jgi:hypothetical protein
MIRSVTATDIQEWLRMRHALWPDGSPAQHRQDIDRYFAGDRREPAEVLLALTANSAPVSCAAHLHSGFQETGRVRTFRKKLVEDSP